MAMYTIEFKVEGHGDFPIDMLRYDSCYPKSQLDVHKIEAIKYETREITLQRNTNAKKWNPTIERWNSFLWKVIDVKLLT